MPGTFRLLNTLLFFVCFMAVGSAQYQKIEVDLSERDLLEVAKLGIAVDHLNYVSENRIQLELPKSDVERLRETKIPFQVLEADAELAYLDRAKKESFASRDAEMACSLGHDIPENFELGRMGGFFTLDEIDQQLQKMRSLYPNLITTPISIGNFKTEEGRFIKYVKISKDVNSSTKSTKVLYTALHHAREPMSMQQLIYFMWYVLENSEKSPAIKQLLATTELVMIPCVNPDGYVYNEKQSPNGGGLWRKNRRDLGGGTYGVDLNRNYGFKWGYDDIGSSGRKSSEVYRGSGPFSEPETQAIKQLCETNQFTLAINAHSYGNYLLYPWSYIDKINDEANIYKQVAGLMVNKSKYAAGTGIETLGYVANGESDDWMFGETGSKNSIKSMTLEVGSGVLENGFWPAKSLITAMCGRVMETNLRLALAARERFHVSHKVPALLTDKTFDHEFTVENLSTVEELGVTVHMKPISDNIISKESIQIFGLAGGIDHAVTLVLDPNTQPGDKVQYLLDTYFDDYHQRDTIRRVFVEASEVLPLFEQSSDLNLWQRDQSSWGVETRRSNESYNTLTDSPGGFYSPGSTSEITTARKYDIPSGGYPVLSYRLKYDIISDMDYAQLMVSTDGSTYSPICGDYSIVSEHEENQGEPVYTGSQSSWVIEEIPLRAYAGEELYFKWKLVSNGNESADGISIANMRIADLTADPTPVDEPLVSGFDIRLYPNPSVSDLATIAIQHGGQGKIKGDLVIRTSDGQLMYKNELNLTVREHQSHIDVHSWPSGTYFVQFITNTGNSRSQRLVVLH